MPCTIYIDEIELWDSKKEEFIFLKPCSITIEHSLISISKWESIWHKPFLSKDNKHTNEELVSYIKCMTISSKNLDERVYDFLPIQKIKEIQQYIGNPMSATKINSKDNKILSLVTQLLQN